MAEAVRRNAVRKFSQGPPQVRVRNYNQAGLFNGVLEDNFRQWMCLKTITNPIPVGAQVQIAITNGEDLDVTWGNQDIGNLPGSDCSELRDGLMFSTDERMSVIAVVISDYENHCNLQILE